MGSHPPLTTQSDATPHLVRSSLNADFYLFDTARPMRHLQNGSRGWHSAVGSSRRTRIDCSNTEAASSEMDLRADGMPCARHACLALKRNLSQVDEPSTEITFAVCVWPKDHSTTSQIACRHKQSLGSTAFALNTSQPIPASGRRSRAALGDSMLRKNKQQRLDRARSRAGPATR